MLNDYEDKDFIIDGFKFGFFLHFSGEESPLHSSNSHSTKIHSDIIEKKINEELRLGRISGPFNTLQYPNSKISPLAIIPKKEQGKFRLIHNLSYPYDETSVNSNILSSDSTVQYSSIANAIEHIQACSPNAFMAKSDIADAFRLIPLHPSQYHLTGFSWKNSFYYDLCLPMGAASSRKIFEHFSDAIKFVLNKHGKKIYH